jgi:hypothetical protein
MGAGKWQPSFNEALRGRGVVILPDNDEPGHLHARLVALSLRGVAAWARVVELPGLPPKGDVSDWLAQPGHGKTELFELVSAELKKGPGIWPGWSVEVPATLDAASASRPAAPTPPDAGDAWEPPIPLADVPEVPPFPIDVLPEPLGRFVAEAARALDCPADYLGVPLLVLAGAALGGSRALEIKTGYEQRPCLYAAIVGPPGSTKSPALALVAQPLQEESWRLKAQWDRAMVEYEADLAKHEASRKNIGAAARDPRPVKPLLRRLVASDATTEALAQVLLENPRGVALVRDEITAWVLTMNQYKGGRGGDRQFFLSAWSGEPATVDRKGSHEKGPLLVPRPFLAVVGGLPPALLPRLRHESGEAVEDGFCDRILFAYPTATVAGPENWLVVSPEARQALADAFARLWGLRMEPVEDGTRLRGWRPGVVRLTAAAGEAWQLFTAAHNAECRDEAFPPHLLGPWSKLRGYCGRLALLVHFLRWACREIEHQDVDDVSMIRAVRLVYYFKAHARKVHAAMGRDQEAEDARRLLAWVARERVDEFKRYEIHKDLQAQEHFQRPDDLDAPLERLVKHGYLRVRLPPPNPRGGRPPMPTFEVNPLWNRRENRENRENPPDGLVEGGFPGFPGFPGDLGTGGTAGNLLAPD